MGIGDWGLGIGIGDWGLGTGDWGLGTLHQLNISVMGRQPTRAGERKYWSYEQARTEGVPVKQNRVTTNGEGVTHRAPRVQETPRYPVHVRATFVRVARRPDVFIGRREAVQGEPGL